MMVSTLAIALSAVLFAKTQTKHGDDHIMVLPDEIQWTAGPPSLPPGAMAAVIEGDPKAAGLFTMRVKLPAGYKVPPHSHPADEHVTVISGKFSMGMGETFDESKAKVMPAGGFAVMMTGSPHFAMAPEDCIIQLHGQGPWGINYVNPEDDPRK